MTRENRWRKRISDKWKRRPYCRELHEVRNKAPGGRGKPGGGGQCRRVEREEMELIEERRGFTSHNRRKIN